VDEMLAEILIAVKRLGATRVVIDSLSGFEIALAPTFRVDFRESLYRLVGALTASGVTIMMTAEVIEPFPGGQFTSERVSFVTDDILVQRLVEIHGHLRKVIAVVKMRGSDHATDFRAFDLTATGAVVSESLVGYHAITSGTPTIDTARLGESPGITAEEAKLLDAVKRLKTASVDKLLIQTGLPEEAIRIALARLSALGYLDAAAKPAEGFRAVARPIGA
jgi:circadian clock protein KaiC